MQKDPIVIFVCEHGAAKSIIAAAYFNQMASEEGLNIRAVARGTNPDHELSESTIRGLAKDGLIPTESMPQLLSLDEIQSAQRIVSFCELPIEFQQTSRDRQLPIPATEQWNNIPPAGENYERARDAIVENLNHLLERIRRFS